MKHELHRSEVQLVLCQHIMEMDVEELIDAFQRATGEPLRKAKPTAVEGYYATLPLSDLIEDQEGFIFWLGHLGEVCRHRLKSNE